jgi:hypothetical protein
MDIYVQTEYSVCTNFILKEHRKMRWYSIFDITNVEHKKYMVKLINKLNSMTVLKELGWAYDANKSLSEESFISDEILINDNSIKFKISKIYERTQDIEYFNLSCIYTGVKFIRKYENVQDTSIKNEEKSVVLIVSPKTILPEINTLFTNISIHSEYRADDYKYFYKTFLSDFCSKEGD